MAATPRRGLSRLAAAIVGYVFTLLTLDVGGTRLCHMLQAQPMASAPRAADAEARAHHGPAHHADPSPVSSGDDAPGPRPEHAPHPCDCPQLISPHFAMPTTALTHVDVGTPSAAGDVTPHAPQLRAVAPPPFLLPFAIAPPLA